MTKTVQTTSSVGAVTETTKGDDDPATSEIQTISGLSLAQGEVYTLTIPGPGTPANYVVVSEVLGATPTVSSLITDLQAKADIAFPGGVVLTEGNPGEIVVTFASKSDESLVQLAKTVSTTTSVGSFVSVDGTGGAATTFTASTLQDARDSFFSVNGLTVQRSSNEIDDVVSGVTFSLNTPVTPAVSTFTTINADVTTALSSTSATTINVSKGAEDLSGAAVEDFVNAYNDLISFYKTESMSSKDPESRGVLNSDST
jgi:flagellar hook-associated protein 2